MTRILATAAAAAIVFAATPLLAQNTVTDAAAHFAASENGDGAKLRLGETSTGNPAEATRFFAQSEDGNGARFRANADISDVSMSTSAGILAAYAAAKLDTGLRGDN